MMDRKIGGLSLPLASRWLIEVFEVLTDRKMEKPKAPSASEELQQRAEDASNKDERKAAAKNLPCPLRRR